MDGRADSDSFTLHPTVSGLHLQNGSSYVRQQKIAGLWTMIEDMGSCGSRFMNEVRLLEVPSGLI